MRLRETKGKVRTSRMCRDEKLQVLGSRSEDMINKVRLSWHGHTHTDLQNIKATSLTFLPSHSHKQCFISAPNGFELIIKPLVLLCSSVLIKKSLKSLSGNCRNVSLKCERGWCRKDTVGNKSSRRVTGVFLESGHIKRMVFVTVLKLAEWLKVYLLF